MTSEPARPRTAVCFGLRFGLKAALARNVNGIARSANTDSYRRTIVVAAPLERVWRAFTVPEELSVWHGRAEVFEAVSGGRVRFADPGHAPVEGVVEEARPNELLRWRVVGDATVIEQRFRASGEKTRVDVSHLNDQAWPFDEYEAISLGWDESLADLMLLVESDVRFTRHMTFKSTLGITTKTTPAGVEVVTVTPLLFGDMVGLKPADLLVQLGSAPLFRHSDLALLTREHAAGEVLEAIYVRNGRLCRGSAPLSARP